MVDAKNGSKELDYSVVVSNPYVCTTIQGWVYADSEARRRLLGEVDVYGQKSALLFFEEHEAYTKDCAPLFFR